MLFGFLKYLQPTHYFQLYRKDGTSIFPQATKLPKEIVAQLQEEVGFESTLAREYDLSWQAVHKGYIGAVETYASFEAVPIVDEYRFVRKYFHPVWVFYVLLLRLLSFNNPFREIAAWRKTRNQKRSAYYNNPISYPDWQNFDSALVKSKPLVSVIIPTLNRYDYLKDVLGDLEKQDYKNFEVIVVDQSAPYRKAFYENYTLDIQLFYQEERALWLARNEAIKKAKGDYILLFDDDSRVGLDWISNHLKCLDFFDADISSGVSLSVVGGEIPKNYAFFCYSSQLDTGNVLLKKDVFRDIGLFDQQFEKQRMGDGEFGLRAYLNGYKNISNPHASRVHLKVGSGGLREMGSWDAFRPKNLLAPRPIPSVLYLTRKYFGNVASRRMIVRSILPSIVPYRFKKNKALKVISFLLLPVFLPLIGWQVRKSWKLAGLKLKEGEIIDFLE